MDIDAFVIGRLKKLGNLTVPELIHIGNQYDISEHDIRNSIQKLIFINAVSIDLKRKLNISLSDVTSLTKDEQIVLGED